MATSKRSKHAQVPPTRATGRESATGTALHEAQRDDVPTGADRGSKVEIQGDPQADLKGSGTSAKPQGAQAEPAEFTSNGQIPHRTVASASGPVPASTVGDRAAGDKAIAQARIDANPAGHRISEATVGRLGRAELMAIGLTRGYEMTPDVGTRATRNAFLKAQDEDKNLGAGEPGAVYEGRSNTRSVSSPGSSPGGKKSARKRLAAKRKH